MFSRYAKVVEADGSAMTSVGSTGDYQRACWVKCLTVRRLSWMPIHSVCAYLVLRAFSYSSGPSGDADSVARAKNTSLSGIEESGIGEARAGKFRLYERSELVEGWLPTTDPRLTVWEALQYLIAALERSESEAAELLHALGGYSERVRQLAYLLYQEGQRQGLGGRSRGLQRSHHCLAQSLGCALMPRPRPPRPPSKIRCSSRIRQVGRLRQSE